MAVKLIVPTALRQYAGGQRALSLEGATVGAVLQQAVAQYPDLGAQIFDSDGKLRSFVNLYRNDDDIRYLDGLDTPVSDRDELSIIPAIAGGSTWSKAQ